MPGVPLRATPVAEAQQLDELRAGAVNMAFVRLPVDKTGLNVIPLYAELPVVVAPRDHPIAVFDEVDVAELVDEYLLQDPDDFPEWRDISSEIQAGTRKPLPEIDSVEAALDLVEAGLGIMILPMSVARLLSRKTLRSRPVTGIAESQVGLAWLRPDGPISDDSDPVIEEFIGVVRGRTAHSSRQPSVQAKQDAAPKKGSAPVGGKAGTKAGGKGAAGAKGKGGRPNSRTGGRPGAKGRNSKRGR